MQMFKKKPKEMFADNVMMIISTSEEVKNQVAPPAGGGQQPRRRASGSSRFYSTVLVGEATGELSEYLEPSAAKAS